MCGSSSARVCVCKCCDWNYVLLIGFCAATRRVLCVRRHRQTGMVFGELILCLEMDKLHKHDQLYVVYYYLYWPVHYITKFFLFLNYCNDWKTFIKISFKIHTVLNTWWERNNTNRGLNNLFVETLSILLMVIVNARCFVWFIIMLGLMFYWILQILQIILCIINTNTIQSLYVMWFLKTGCSFLILKSNIIRLCIS